MELLVLLFIIYSVLLNHLIVVKQYFVSYCFFFCRSHQDMEQRKTAKAKTTTRYILIVRTGVDTRVDIREEECQTSSNSTVCE